MTVGYTNTSSLVSFLLMKPYTFLTLNHPSVPKTSLARILLFPPPTKPMWGFLYSLSLDPFGFCRTWWWQRWGGWLVLLGLHLAAQTASTAWRPGYPGFALLSALGSLGPRRWWGCSSLGVGSQLPLWIKFCNKFLKWLSYWNNILKIIPPIYSFSWLMKGIWNGF